VSDRTGILDRAAWLLMLSPLRCRKCRLRYYRPWFVAKRALPAIERPDPVRAPAFVSSPVPVSVIRPGILLLDDDPPLRKLFRRLLDREGYEVREASDCGAALEELRGAKMNLVVVNLNSAQEAEKAVWALRIGYAELTIVVCIEEDGLLERSENLLILPRPSRPFTVVSAIARALACQLPT
jgi:hypothetical protein